MKAPRRLYRSASGEVVDESDPRAAFLLVNVGKDVPEAYEAKVKAYLGAAAPPPGDEPVEKQAAKPVDKAVKKTTNKGR